MTEIVKDPLTKQECIDWIAALRSGKYEQGIGQFCKTDILGDKSYCCLGVANVIWNLGKSDGYACIVEEEVDNDNEVYLKMPRKQQELLYNMNDAKKLTFPQIADYIEQEILPTLES